MNGSQVRFAQIGVDHTHAAGYCESLLLMPGVEIVALYDADPEGARPLILPALRDVPVYDDLPMLLRQERPEAVLITLPNDATPAAIATAAQAGAHVFAEKPCARTAGEFLAAMEAIRVAGVQFATGYLRRSSPVGQAIKDLVDAGLLGRLISMEARWITTSVTVRDPAHYYFSGERSGGGILHWLGCHWLDFMRWATSAEVVEVAAILDTLSGEAIGVEDTAAVSLRYRGGWAQEGSMLGSLHCAYVTDRATDQLFFGLRGTLGWVVWDKSDPELLAHSTHPAWATAPTRVQRYDPDLVGGYGGAQGILALRRFIASFREGTRPAFVPEDALRVLEVLDAAHESAACGRRISLGG
jgi:predicted dehydrogenase